jgi:uncharacterized protein YbjQ (UPF0145 family)
MMLKTGISITALCLLLSACVGPLVPVAKVDPTTSRQLESSVAVYDPGLAPTGAMSIKPITATSCKNKAWDPAPTRENAITQLKLYAQQAGGNIVGNLTCDSPAGTDLATNCWSSITCRGTAMKSSQQ